MALWKQWAPLAAIGLLALVVLTIRFFY